MKKSLLSLCGAMLGLSAAAAAYTPGQPFVYDFTPSFSFTLSQEDGTLYDQYPADAVELYEWDTEDGLTSAWFNGKRFATVQEANEYCPVVEDPWNAGQYVLRMQTTSWDGFGGFTFALPNYNQPCRVRVIYRVDEKAAQNDGWYSGHAQKTFKVKFMTNNDQDFATKEAGTQVEEYNEDFWDNPGWRTAEFINAMEGDVNYISLLFDAAGLSCGRNVPFYVKQVSVEPLADGTQTGTCDLLVTETMPTLVQSSIAEINAENANSAAIYDLMGHKLAAPVRGINIVNGQKVLVK